MKAHRTQKHFLVVDNGSRMLPLVLRRLHEAGHTYVRETYDPFMPLSDEGYDAIILSGGMIHEVMDTLPGGNYWFEQEFELIRRTNKPVLGICLGLQMITVALGGTLGYLPALITGKQTLSFDDSDTDIFGRSEMDVYQTHRWIAEELPASVKAIVRSNVGIEMIQHRSRPIIATQFHPEVSEFQFDILCTTLFNLTGMVYAEESPSHDLMPSLALPTSA